MLMQKKMGLYLLIGLLLISFASASILDSLESLKTSIGITEPLIITLLRVGILILIAVLLFEGLSHVGLSQGTSIAISIVLALISVVAMPGSILATIASTYGVLFSFILIMIPLGGLLFVIYGLIPGDRLVWRIVRIVLILVLIYFFFRIKTWVGTL